MVDAAKPEVTDEELFAAYVGGDSVAFRALFDRHAPGLLRMMRRGMSSQTDARDLVQQTFLQLHRARHDFRKGAKLRPWLYTIGLNVKRQHLRTLKRKPEAPLDDDSPLLPTTEPYDPVKADRARLLHEALEQLPENQRQAIELHWLEGLPFPEVAEVVGASLSAVKVRAHRGYAKLREVVLDLDASFAPPDEGGEGGGGGAS